MKVHIVELFKVGQPNFGWAAFSKSIKKLKMEEKKTIISLPLDLHTDLKKYAAANQISMKDVVVEALESLIYERA